MLTNRRTFIKSAGMLTAAAAFLNPSSLFAQRNAKKSGASKVMKLEWLPFNAQMKHVFTISNSSRTTTPIVLTQITYDGVTGYGEAAMPPYLGESQASVMEYLKKVDLSQFSSPFMIEDITAYLDSITTNNTAAKASVDIALHDLVGKLIGQPWWKIWGFNPTTCPETTYTIGLASKEEVIEKTKELLNDPHKFKIIKVKLGRDEQTDKMMINTIRSVTNTLINVDANQGWKDKHYALDMINWLNERNVGMIEQPMPKLMLDETAWLRDNSPLPLIADESCQRLTDVKKLHGAFDGINIKLMKCTGLREAREMVSLANTLGMKIMIGCMTETSCAISAAAQIAPKTQWADLDGHLLISNDCFRGMQIVNGKITLEDKPGLGLERI
jgi:L-alanine-DL-glutamate epimerase and related enzymes of enolase superfamily